MPNFRALICDFDGTLVDTYSDVTQQVSFCIQEVLGRSAIFSRDLMGSPIREILKSIIRHDEVECLDELSARFRMKHELSNFERSRVYQGVKSTLFALRESGLRTFVLSNKPQSSLEILLNRFNLREFFDNIYSAKPENGGKRIELASLLQAEGLIPREVVYIGDTMEDVQAALYNGCIPVWASYGYGSPLQLKQSSGPLSVDRFEELGALFT